MVEVDYGAPGWVKLTLLQRIRLLCAKYTSNYVDVLASNGQVVKASPEFAEQHWKCPDLYQDMVDNQAYQEKMIHDY